jgi:hypothetical protein
MGESCYTIQRASPDSDKWRMAETFQVDHFHPQSTSVHPLTTGWVVYDERCLYWSFRVLDRHVRAEHLSFQDPVCQDSCVEFFVQPACAPGYFNFEVNCIGTLHVSFIEDPTRTATGLARSTAVSASHADMIRIQASMPREPCLPEKAGPLEWRIEAWVPFEFFRFYAPKALSPDPSTEWRGNFYKCGDRTSRPHWAAWAPIGAALNFHVPASFGILRFA